MTTARTCVASRTLFEHLKQIPGVRFEKRQPFIKLADDSVPNQALSQVSLTAEIGKRTFIAEFVILSKTKDNRILLGMDFLEKSASFLMIPQSCRYFANKPTEFLLILHKKITIIFCSTVQFLQSPLRYQCKSLRKYM